MSLHSTASCARKETASLRSTIPEGIVAYLDIRDGDRLDWKMETVRGKRIVIFTKDGKE